ncbi:small GTPase superfamily [Phellopilus nigrolimitatus]|nr:small GTPase superfamily [Phellopilus nigrolimitatus]KAH8096929.1 small GTPase superfamily [Phellopilus nigrolimitatus]KAH8118260.1 small GTPase superfamily [Phellopilus nigrolimitatus]
MTGDILRKRKIAVLGSRSVGKSSLVIKYVEDHFVDSYYPTIESTFTKSIPYKGVEYDCDIIDTAGQDEYSILNQKHAVGIHGFVLVYSVASRNSFDMVQIVHDKIVTFTGNQAIPCVIVGSKTDLPQRQVSPEEGEAFAKSIDAAWVETSAKTNLNVGKVFDLVLFEIEKRAPHNQGQPVTRGCLIM